MLHVDRQLCSEYFLQSCVHLKTLILDGISIDDDTLQSIQWDASCLTHVELGWCPLITQRGLNTALPWVTKIQSLEYLGLCRSIGDSKALNDELLLGLAASLTSRPNKKLQWLNLSCSRCITKHGLDRLRSFAEFVDATNCPAVKASLGPSMVTGTMKMYDENGNVCLTVDAGSTRKKRFFETPL